MARARGRGRGARAVRRADHPRRRRPRRRGRGGAVGAPRIERLAREQLLRRREELAEVYRAALGESERRARSWSRDSLPRHLARGDFVFLAAVDEADESVAGFAYGYAGAYGQWWTDRVAATLDEELRARWLDGPHFEVAELHVRPDRQRLGIGGALLRELLAAQPHPRALLTTPRDDARARAFYAKHGWQELGEIRFGAGYPPYALLGKELLAG